MENPRDEWPAAEGPAADLIRSHDWSANPLGSPATWPPALRAAVDVVLFAPCALGIFWGDDAIAIYNDQFSELVGSDHPTLLGASLFTAWPDADGVHRPALTAVRREGRTVTLDVGGGLTFSPIASETGLASGMIAAQAIGGEETASAALQRLNRKLAAFGQLGGSLAHEFNNLLQAIIGSLELVQTRIARGRTNEIERFVQNSISAANRAAALTHRLLAFSRSQALLSKDEDPDRRARVKRTLHGEVVLVVEDDPVVRGLVTEVLDDLGYLALEAEDGPAAMKILQSPSQIDLLIIDIGLPGMNGRQVAEEAGAIRQGMKVLFMTGYADEAEDTSPNLGAGMQVMTKPFAIEALGTRIRSIIESP